MKKIILIFILIFITSCTTISKRSVQKSFSKERYTNIDTFCKKYDLEYDYDTVSDIVRIYSDGRQIKLLLNSNIGSFNEVIFNLDSRLIYKNGSIWLPKGLDKIFSKDDFAVLRPVFQIKTIVIDPGHGGKDPGAISSRGLKEKDINLVVSKYLKQALEGYGFKVILTRDKDIYLSLGERTEVAKRYKADLFISIHANSNCSKNVKGAEIYHLLPSRLNSTKRALQLAKTESFFGRKFSGEVETILWDLSIRRNFSSSVELSNILYFTFKKLGINVKQPRKAPFYVLRFAYVPSVLVEMGYLSNYQEEKILRKKYYQKQIVNAISQAIVSLDRRYADFAKN